MDVTILGGGISGITTGLLLRALGHAPTIVTHRRADRSYAEPDPLFASLYPAASVIPHAVQVDDVVRRMRETQLFFEILRQHGTFGIRQQRHYEVFESPPPAPAYAPAMHDFQWLPDDGSGAPGVPRRSDAKGVYGWTFRAYFAETPTYLTRLYDLFDAAGGQVRSGVQITRDTLPSLPGQALVNCLGAGSRFLFPDPAPHSFLQGYLVYATPNRPAVDRRHREVCSYNYHPPASVYHRPDGSPAGVYAYPRTDTWVIGGTKRPGEVEDGTWRGPPVSGPTVNIDGHAIPQPVVEVNADLLHSLFDVDIRQADLRATEGVRFARDLNGGGVRLEADTCDGRLLIHNYGHGGAGVTLSWSTALQVARSLTARGENTTSGSAPPAAASHNAPPVLSALARTARSLGLDPDRV